MQYGRHCILLERPQFHIETVESGLNYGRYKADPMEPGYGTTLGNALRRILLRLLEGGGIAGAPRQRLARILDYSKCAEDVTEIVLNFSAFDSSA